MAQQQKIDDKGKIIITTEYPTHIVEDFRTYLTYLLRHPIKLTKANGYFTKKDLLALYSQMKGEKREIPQHLTQIGYPILHLFHQLSIVLDFIRVHRTQSSAAAVIQKQQIDTFLDLTATEQYLTLLEAFWTEADWEVLQGEKWGSPPHNIDFLFDQLEGIPANKEIKLSWNKEINSHVSRYGQFFYYFTYFGFWTFLLDEEKSNDPERPISTIAKSITLTHLFKKIQHILSEAWDPFKDDALNDSFALFEKLFNLPIEIEKEVEGERTQNTESLVTLLRPLFSNGELRSKLKRKQPLFNKGMYLFKVKFGNTCWRTLQLAGTHTLLDLHELIQKAFEFDDDHLYAFYMDGKKFGKSVFYSPMDIQGPYVNIAKIGGLNLYEGQSFLYLFDFGDEWEFEVQVLKITEEEELGAAKIKEKFGNSPDQYRW